MARPEAARGETAAAARARLHTELLCKLVLERLNEEFYAATLAGLSYDLYPTCYGVAIRVDGFSHKLPALAVRICAEIASLAASPSDEGQLRRVCLSHELALANAGFAPEKRCAEI